MLHTSPLFCRQSSLHPLMEGRQWKSHQNNSSNHVDSGQSTTLINFGQEEPQLAKKPIYGSGFIVESRPQCVLCLFPPKAHCAEPGDGCGVWLGRRQCCLCSCCRTFSISSEALGEGIWCEVASLRRHLPLGVPCSLWQQLRRGLWVQQGHEGSTED